jgi:hypothetical protein
MRARSPKSNRGKIYLQHGRGPWRMKASEDAPSGNEFEAFTMELTSFLEGYFSALGRRSVPAYVQGDFFYERTEAIHFRRRSYLTAGLIRSLQRWLSAPRRRNWRILIPGESDRFIVVYHDTVAISPDVRSLAYAIADNDDVAYPERI